jgi:hypothetical protein
VLDSEPVSLFPATTDVGNHQQSKLTNVLYAVTTPSNKPRAPEVWSRLAPSGELSRSKHNDQVFGDKDKAGEGNEGDTDLAGPDDVKYSWSEVRCDRPFGLGTLEGGLLRQYHVPSTVWLYDPQAT